MSSLQTPTFFAFAGDTITINTQVLNPDGSPFDLSGVTGINYVLASGYGQPAMVTKTLGNGITITAATSGMYTVTLAPADTAGLVGNYLHASTLLTSGNVNTVFSGILTLTGAP